MSDFKHTILLTKVFPGDVITRLNTVGIRCVQHSFVQFNYTTPQNITDGFLKTDVPFVFTSQNAVIGFERSGLKQPVSKKAYSLSGATKTTLQQYGWEVVGVAEDSASLASVIIQHKPSAVVFCCGNLRMDTIPQLLTQAGIQIIETEVYTTTINSIKVEDAFDAVVFYSPSGVESFFQTNELAITQTAFCIGATTAKALSEHWAGNIIISPTATADALLETVINYYK